MLPMTLKAPPPVSVQLYTLAKSELTEVASEPGIPCVQKSANRLSKLVVLVGVATKRHPSLPRMPMA
jgi:hypothetical protein